MPKNKEHSIRFRCSEDLYQFIDSLRSAGRSDANKRSKSEVVRHILNIFRISTLCGDLNLNEFIVKLNKRLQEDKEQKSMKQLFGEADGQE